MWVTIIAFFLAAFYLLAVTPVRTYFEQRAQMHQAQQRYTILATTNKQLQERAVQLQSNEEIKRLARERYELVEPGQQAFAVMPPSPTVNQSDTESNPAMHKQHSLAERMWNFVDPWN
jgi:cell division protein FtsB